MARQILWIMKKIPFKNKFNNNEHYMKECFNSQKVGIQLLVFNIEVCKFFGTKEFLQEVE